MTDGWPVSPTTRPNRARSIIAPGTPAQAGRATNALTLFTNFVAQLPNQRVRPARPNVGGGLLLQHWATTCEAERNYKLLFQNTNWPPAELTYQAQLMAGRAAVARQDWKDARAYFTQLYNNTNGPSIDLRLQALVRVRRRLDERGGPGRNQQAGQFGGGHARLRPNLRRLSDQPAGRPGLGGKGQLLFAVGAGPTTVRLPDQCAQCLPAGR